MAPAANPFPYSQAIPLSIILLNEMMCMSTLFPIIGFLVAKLQGVPVEEAGYMSGILLGLFMLGQISSAKMWGYISDVYGRRFPLISGLFTSGLSVLFFGFSTSFWSCAFFRFCQGLFNGNILVAKTMIADITDKTNQATGFAITGFTYGVGLIIGPALGGLLYDPVNNMEWLHLSEDSIFASRPALLASMFIFLYSLLGMLICTYWLKESNLHAKEVPWIAKMIYPCLWVKAENFIPPPLPEDIPVIVVESADAPASDERTSVPNETADEGDRAEEDSPPVVVAEEDDSKSFGYRQAFQHPELCFMLVLYMVWAGGDTLFNETVPLWVIASPSVGGYSFTSKQVGFLLLFNGFPCVISTLTFPKICERYADKAGLFRFAAIMCAVITFFIPFTSYFGRGFFSVTVLVICQCVRSTVVLWCFSLCTMLTARSAPQKFIGASMGISQSSCALARCCVPFIFAPLFAWSISGNHIFPFNFCLNFVISAGAALYCWFRMYMASCNAEGKIVLLEGGAPEAFQRLKESAKRFFSA